MAIRPAFPLLSDLLVADGLAGGQTMIGDTQAGGDVAVQDNTTEVGGMEFFGPIAVDRTGVVTKIGIKDYNPQHELSVPADTYFQGVGSGAASFVNGVLQAGGATGSIFGRDTNLSPAVIAPITPSDVLTLGPEDPTWSPASALLVNVPSSFGGGQALAVRLLASASMPFVVGANGNVGFGTTTVPNNKFEIYGAPLAMSGQQPLTTGHFILNSAVSPPALAATPSYVAVWNIGGTLYCSPLYAISGGGGGGGGGGTGLPTDTFNRSNGDIAAAPSSPSGHTWVDQMNHYSVITNHVQPTLESAAYTFRIATLNGQSATGKFHVQFVNLIQYMALAFRWHFDGSGTGSNTDANCNGFLVQYNGSVYQVLYWPGAGHGSFTQLLGNQAGGNVSGTPTAGDYIQVELSAISPKVKVNTSPDGATWTNRWQSNATDDANVLLNNVTEVNHGLSIQSGTGYDTAQFDQYAQDS